MLPFEDRYSRQRRLPEVGSRGQQQLGQAQLRIAPHPDVLLELDYLERAGVAGVAVDEVETPLVFPWTDWFEHASALAVARGAWCALTRIKAELPVDPARSHLMNNEMAINVEESASNRPVVQAENATASPVRAGAFSQPGDNEKRSIR